jgi:hypothetical protein
MTSIGRICSATTLDAALPHPARSGALLQGGRFKLVQHSSIKLSAIVIAPALNVMSGLRGRALRQGRHCTSVVG